MVCHCHEIVMLSLRFFHSFILDRRLLKKKIEMMKVYNIHMWRGMSVFSFLIFALIHFDFRMACHVLSNNIRLSELTSVDYVRGSYRMNV